MSDFKQHIASTTIQAHRKGWIGVWDALVAAVTGNSRMTVETPVVMSVYARVPDGSSIDLVAMQAKQS